MLLYLIFLMRCYWYCFIKKSKRNFFTLSFYWILWNLVIFIYLKWNQFTILSKKLSTVFTILRKFIANAQNDNGMASRNTYFTATKGLLFFHLRLHNKCKWNINLPPAIVERLNTEIPQDMCKTKRCTSEWREGARRFLSTCAKKPHFGMTAWSPWGAYLKATKGLLFFLCIKAFTKSRNALKRIYPPRFYIRLEFTLKKIKKGSWLPYKNIRGWLNNNIFRNNWIWE